jgi:hypothetical protein
VCRCGVERQRLDALGIDLEAVPIIHAPVEAAPRPAAEPGVMRRLIGHRGDDDLPSGWRLTLKIAWGLGVVAVAALMITVTQRDPLPRRGNIRIVSTLADVTEDAGPTAANTMPAFMALPGALGALPSTPGADEPVQALDEGELRQGFCTQSVSRQIRHQYPGYYDEWPDDKLERVALEKYPEMRERLCALPYAIDATPAGIIKYELKPRTFVMAVTMWMATVLVTLAFAGVCANLYYRVLVARLSAA